jgi:hypothetical protein
MDETPNPYESPLAVDDQGVRNAMMQSLALVATATCVFFALVNWPWLSIVSGVATIALVFSVRY